MGISKVAIALVLVLLFAALLICVVHSGVCGVASCGQVTLSLMLPILTYFLLYESMPQISLVASTVTRTLHEPPR